MHVPGCCCCSVAQSWLTLWPHGLQRTRLPCPSLTPGVCSHSCPLSWWCLPTISSSVVPFSSCLQSFPALGSFPVSQFFASGGQSIRISASASVLPMNMQGWFPLGLGIQEGENWPELTVRRRGSTLQSATYNLCSWEQICQSPPLQCPHLSGGRELNFFGLGRFDKNPRTPSSDPKPLETPMRAPASTPTLIKTSERRWSVCFT